MEQEYKPKILTPNADIVDKISTPKAQEAVRKLLALLTLRKLDIPSQDNSQSFEGDGHGGETSNRIYGGQVVAQALQAAYQTVHGQLCHSLHAYFLRPGKLDMPVRYDVLPLRDGKSFTTRRITAIQSDHIIFDMLASFHRDEEGFDHQHHRPDFLPDPELLPPRDELRRAKLRDLNLEPPQEDTRLCPIDIREIEPQNPFAPQPRSDRNALWFRLVDKVSVDQPMQQCLLAYASDMHLLSSGARPHGLSWSQSPIMGASLDHAMWFHHPIDFSDWHVYAMEAPFTGKARSYNRGLIHDQHGRLVASVTQEGLMRPLDERLRKS